MSINQLIARGININPVGSYYKGKSDRQAFEGNRLMQVMRQQQMERDDQLFPGQLEAQGLQNKLLQYKSDNPQVFGGLGKLQKGVDGTVFDQNTGTYSIDPGFMEHKKNLYQMERDNNLLKLKQQTDQEAIRKRNDLTAQRNSNIIGTRNEQIMELGASSRKVNRALKLAEQATQGFGGPIKLFASRIFPGVEVDNEAGLEQAFTQLTMDELARFKGPTTDFEFGVSQTIPGQLSDGRSGNIAKLKSIKRNHWFISEEDRQFKAHLKSGGTAEEFRFNMLKEIKTKSGLYKLEDIQATAVENHLTIQEVIQRLNQ